MENKKKIYTLTFHRAINYGGVLQCVALYKFISNFTKCEVIDYHSKCIDDRYKFFKKNLSIKDIIKSTVLLPKTLKKKNKFNNFLSSNVNLTKEFKDYNDLIEYNWENNAAFCVGSDQVWNVDLTNYDPAYVLNFVQNGNKYSYAASIGRNLDLATSNYFKDSLKDFKTISVREKTAKSELDMININSFTNIDPVFLLKKDEWESIATKPNVKNYVLVYLLQKSDRFMNKIMEYAKNMNLEVVIISTGLRRNLNATYIDDCSPEEFVGYFLNATTIFTNSFHGISFSILSNKLFYYELQSMSETNSRNSRLSDVINLFNLEKNNVSNYKSIPLQNEINYEFINKTIEQKRNDAIFYIQSIIK